MKYMQLDGAGENKTFKELVNGLEWKHNPIFQYTGTDTPQRNHLAEIRFVTIWARVRAMMHDANIPVDVQVLVYCKAISHLTRLDGLMIAIINGHSRIR